MVQQQEKDDLQNLPECAAAYIRHIVKRMRYRHKVRLDVQAELAAHFIDELKNYKNNDEKNQKARQLIVEFGDAKLLAVLLRRAKKRCRPLWRTVVVRTFQSIGILIVCFIIYAVWFSFGEPTIRIDYIELLNQIKQPQIRGQDNAWPHYERAIELYVPQNPLVKQFISYRSVGRSEREDALQLKEMLRDNEQKIHEWLEENQKYWDNLNSEQKAIYLNCIEYDIVLLYKDAPEFPEYHSDMYTHKGWGTTTIEQMAKHIVKCIKEDIQLTTPALPGGLYNQFVDAKFPKADLEKFLYLQEIPPNNLEAVSVAVLRETMKRFRDLPDDISESLTDIESEYISYWIEQNEAAWQEFATGSTKSYCFKPYSQGPDTKDKLVWSMMLPHLSSLRELARMGVWRSRIERAQGQLQQSIDDCICVARAGSHLQGKGLIVEQLVGCSMSNLGHEEILRILANYEFSSAELQRLQGQMSKIYPEEYPLLNIEGERIGFMDFVQRSFTDGGPGGGHLIPGQWEEVTNLGSVVPYAPDVKDKRLLIPFYTAASIAHARRDATISKANEIYNLQSKIVSMTPYERYVSDIKTAEELMYSTGPNNRFFLIRIFMPAAARASEIVYRGKIKHEATIAILELLRWRLEKNQYPSTLSELAADGFLKLPIDPWSGKPLVYKKTDDSFILYSIGENFVDNGGEYGVLENGRISNWLDNGDTIFWPQINMEKIKIKRKRYNNSISPREQWSDMNSLPR